MRALTTETQGVSGSGGPADILQMSLPTRGLP